MSDQRAIPSIDKLLQSPIAIAWTDKFGRGLVTDVLRTAADEIRSGKLTSVGSKTELILQIAENNLSLITESSLRKVINATGVVLHTNLGRAPIGAAGIESIRSVSSGYSSLEFDLDTGKRGSRESSLVKIFQQITGAESVHICNNNAAAVLLTLTALARRKPVIIARSQLVEIGGGFRIPEVMKQSGAKLIEVGTTNRVHLADYADALKEHPNAIVMHAHPSNFRVIGFTEEPGIEEVANLAHQHETLLIDDLGSGALIDTANYGLAHEPTVLESLAAGSDIVCFSGDKLFGGPQAGIILGSKPLIQKIAKHQLARALRVDKLNLNLLFHTALAYAKGAHEQEIPIWSMISQPAEVIKKRAEAWREELGIGEVVPGESAIGGGSLPGETMPTWNLLIPHPKPQKLLDRLRTGNIPVIGFIKNGAVHLDPRTVLPNEDSALILKCNNVLNRS